MCVISVKYKHHNSWCWQYFNAFLSSTLHTQSQVHPALVPAITNPRRDCNYSISIFGGGYSRNLKRGNLGENLMLLRYAVECDCFVQPAFGLLWNVRISILRHIPTRSLGFQLILFRFEFESKCHRSLPESPKATSFATRNRSLKLLFSEANLVHPKRASFGWVSFRNQFHIIFGNSTTETEIVALHTSPLRGNLEHQHRPPQTATSSRTISITAPYDIPGVAWSNDRHPTMIHRSMSAVPFGALTLCATNFMLFVFRFVWSASSWCCSCCYVPWALVRGLLLY